MQARALPRDVLELGHGFWNLRGSFKIARVLEIGSQASLVRLASGRYVLLDACALSEDALRWLDAQTEGGAAIEAILHLHPFHTLHVRAWHARYPSARLHGTARHAKKASELPWDALRTDEPELAARYADDLELTVPSGVELIPADEHLHFSSVLAIHRPSRTLHVDDTLNHVGLPRLLGGDLVRFHPTLARVLEKRPGAARDFREWARHLIARCEGIENLCAAHTSAMLGRDARGASASRRGSVSRRIEAALARVEPTLRAHEAAHG